MTTVDPFKHIVLVKGLEKTDSVKTLGKTSNGRWQVTYESGKSYSYAPDNITLISGAKDMNPAQWVVVGTDKRKLMLAGEVTRLACFCSGWLVIELTDPSGMLKTRRFSPDKASLMAVSDYRARQKHDPLRYFWQVARASRIDDAPQGESLLGRIYAMRGIFNRAGSVLQSYLNPIAHPLKTQKRRTHTFEVQQTPEGDPVKCRMGLASDGEPLIFPFGVNASQSLAVERAFLSSLSIIQGPPGTGKTQTILNILANLLLRGKTAMVVSHSNPATDNVAEKLERHHLNFLLANVGNKDKRDAFLADQTAPVPEMADWALSAQAQRETRAALLKARSRLTYLFDGQARLVKLNAEYDAVTTEYRTFCAHFVPVPALTALFKPLLAASVLEELLEHLKTMPTASRWRWVNSIRRLLQAWKLRRFVTDAGAFMQASDSDQLAAAEGAWYRARIAELTVQRRESQLVMDKERMEALQGQVQDLSMRLLKDALYQRYKGTAIEPVPVDADGQTILDRYPVVLSTTHSCRTTLGTQVMFDFVIVDEASQVSIETGVLALAMAENAVVVGDRQQLPNVVKPEHRQVLDAVWQAYDLPAYYDCGQESLLSSLSACFPDAPDTLLREHYRCHPKIIGFCNRLFYGNRLMVMTKAPDDGVVPMKVYRTVPGNHQRQWVNRREVDVIEHEVLTDPGVLTRDVGIVAPYNEQVNAIASALPGCMAATVHKFQGRECETMILSTVNNRINDFVDDPQWLNVAVSRAKKQFVLVTNGNESGTGTRIDKLIDYVRYESGQVTNSKVCSIFDCLYSQNTQALDAFKKAQGASRTGEVSEDLTLVMLEKLIKSEPLFSGLKVYLHYPLSRLVWDRSELNDREKAFVSHPYSHVDFLLADKVTRKPVLAVETDGHAFHDDNPEQLERDAVKDRVLMKVNLPMVRLSTTGSREELRVRQLLKGLLAG